MGEHIESFWKDFTPSFDKQRAVPFSLKSGMNLDIQNRTNAEQGSRLKCMQIRKVQTKLEETEDITQGKPLLLLNFTINNLVERDLSQEQTKKVPCVSHTQNSILLRQCV